MLNAPFTAIKSIYIPYARLPHSCLLVTDIKYIVQFLTNSMTLKCTIAEFKDKYYTTCTGGPVFTKP